MPYMLLANNIRSFIHTDKVVCVPIEHNGGQDSWPGTTATVVSVTNGSVSGDSPRKQCPHIRNASHE